MPKRRAKKVVKEPSVNLQGDGKDAQTTKLKYDKQQYAFSDHEVERRITAIRAIRDAETEDLLTRLRLLRSYLTKEQLNTPLLQFFKENCPSLLVVKNEKDGELELELKVGDCNQAPFHRASVSCPDLAGFMPSIGGLEFTSKAVKEHFVGAASMHIPDFIMEENSETQMLGLRDSFQTPGITGQKLSIGMTPKTLRLPKPGEMLLSVHGSPLGLYREDNMEAIAESDDEA